MEAEMVAVVALSEEDMRRMEEEAKQAAERRQTVLAGLAADIQGKFTDRSSRRQMIERGWVESMRLYLGSLSAAQYETVKAPFAERTRGANKPYHNLVKTKCAVAVAQSVSSQFAGGDKNWCITPTPVPAGDPKQNEIAAKEMEREIEDQLTEEKYGLKCRKAMEDRVILGTGVLKGPVPATDSKLTYEVAQDEMGNIQTIPVYTVQNRPVIERVDPWMFFPDDTVNDIKDACDAIELHPMSKSQLAKLLQNPGFDKDAVKQCLQMEPASYTNETFSEYSTLTDSGVNFLRNKYAVLEYHGPITIDQLGALGIEPSYDPLGDTFYGEVWVCQGVVLRVELEAISGLYQLPYMVCPWEKDPNSIFGFSLPQTIKDPQRIAQVTLDMILENASISSGPIAIINKSFIEPFDGDWTLYPNKLFGTTDYTLQNVAQAMTFIDVPNMSNQLFPILQFAREVAQEESTVPLLANGLQSAQVGSDSATGLAIMQQNQTTVSDFKAEEWDDSVTEPLIQRMYHWNMQYNAKPELIGDFDVDVKSSTEYRNKQLFVRDVEKLSVESAQNPALAQVINMPELQRVRLSMMHIPSKTIIKTDEQLAEEQAQAAQNPPPPDPALLKAEAEMARIRVDEMKLQLEQDKLQFEATKQQQREMWDHQERQEASRMRFLEAQARVIEANAQREIELAKLAQKDASDNAWIMAELQKSQIQADTLRFQSELDTAAKYRQQALMAAELKYAEREGKGV